MKFDKYTIETKGIDGVCKSPSAWGCEKGTGRILPLVYFRQPKWLSNADFQQVIKSIRIGFSANTEFCGSEESKVEDGQAIPCLFLGKCHLSTICKGMVCESYTPAT